MRDAAVKWRRRRRRKRPSRSAGSCRTICGASRWFLLSCAAIGLGVLGAVLLVEGLLLRGVVEFNAQFTPVDQRVRAVLYLALFGATVLLLELKIAAGLLRYGRVLEIRFRMALCANAGAPERPVFPQPARVGHGGAHSRGSPSALVPRAGWPVRPKRHRARADERRHRADRAARRRVVVMAAVAVTLGLSIGIDAAGGPSPDEGENACRCAGALLPRRVARPERHPGAHRRSRASGASRNRCSSSGAAPRSPSFARCSHSRPTQLLVGFGFATWLLKIHLAYGGEPGATLLLMYWALNYPLLGAEIASSITSARRGKGRDAATARAARRAGAAGRSRRAGRRS